MQRLGRFLDAESGATGLPLRGLLVLAVAIHVWVTLLAVNPIHPDEHFQILEFAWARAGYSAPAVLPWEWSAQMRPTLQPTLALGLLRALRAVGLTSPFVWVQLLRLASLALAFGVLLAVFARESPTLDRRGRRALWLTGLLLWIAPLFFARFSSENFGGMALAAAIVCIENDAALPRGRRRLRRDAVAGALLGLSFVCRFQMILAIVPVLGWVAMQHDEGVRARAPRRALAMAFCAVLVVMAGSLLDSWFYGAAVFTPWNYFQVNVLAGKAASFGTSPWYAYLVGVPLWLAPPLGVALVGFAGVGLVTRPRSPWTWAVLAFLGGHTLIGHKEVRFLLPMLYVLPLLVARGISFVPSGRLWRVGGRLLLLQNALLLLLAVTPALHRGKEFDGHYLRWLWDDAERQPGEIIYVLADEESPYRTWGLETSVYRHPRVRGVPHRSGDPIPRAVPVGTPPERLLVLARGGTRPSVAGADATRLVYEAQPGYRALANVAGLRNASWLRWLEAKDGWTNSDAVRTLYEVRMIPRADTASSRAR